MIIKRSFPRQILRRILLQSPRSRPLFDIARRYAEDYLGEFNPDMRINGELRALRAVLRRPSHGQVIALDIGANTGEWTALALRLSSELFIHGFEPCLGSFQKLARHKFPSNRVRLNQLAVGQAKGIAWLNVYGPDAETNSLLKRAGYSNDNVLQQEVQVITIDDYIQENKLQRIAYLKIDVEGFELNALKGAEKSVANGMFDAIQFEYGEGWSDARVFLKDFLDWAKCYPYDIFKIAPHWLTSVRRYNHRLENFRMSNYLMVKRGAFQAGALGRIREL